MKVLKKYKLVTTANNYAVVTAYEKLKDAISYQDEFIDFCCLHSIDFEVALYSLDDSQHYVLRNEGCQKFNPVDFKTTLDLS